MQIFWGGGTLYGPSNLYGLVSANFSTAFTTWGGGGDGGRFQKGVLQRTSTENTKQIFPAKELCGHSPNFHIHVSVMDLYIPRIDLPILQEICGPILEI
jgi:hypothetical protein